MLCLLQGGGQPGAAQPRASWALGGAVTLQQPGPPLPRHTADQRGRGERAWTAPWGLVVAAADRAVAWAWVALRCETCAWAAAGSAMSISQSRPIACVGSISLGRCGCCTNRVACCCTRLPVLLPSPLLMHQLAPSAFHICSHNPCSVTTDLPLCPAAPRRLSAVLHFLRHLVFAGAAGLVCGWQPDHQRAHHVAQVRLPAGPAAQPQEPIRRWACQQLHSGEGWSSPEGPAEQPQQCSGLSVTLAAWCTAAAAPEVNQLGCLLSNGCPLSSLLPAAVLERGSARLVCPVRPAAARRAAGCGPR